MSKLCCFIVLVASISVLPHLSAGAPQTEKFTLTSFIPERFVDLEWEVNGKLGLSGGVSSDSRDRTRNDLLGYESSHWSNTEFDSDARTQARLRTYSPVQASTVTMSLIAELGSRRYNRYDTVFSHEVTGNAAIKEKRSGARASLYPSVDYTRYMYRDCFAAVEATGRLSYITRPTIENRRTEHRITRYFPGFTREEHEYYSHNSSSTGRDNYARVKLYLGNGRMYTGYYAATAMYIVEELRDKGILTKDLLPTELLELTEFVYQRRLKHAIDSREFQSETLLGIVDFLQSRQLVSHDGHAAIVTQDVWRYYPSDERRFGWYIRGGFSLSYGHRSEHESEIQTRDIVQIRYHDDSAHVIDTLYQIHTRDTLSYHERVRWEEHALVLQAAYSRPLSFKWQFNSLVTATAYRNDDGQSRTDGSYPRTENRYVLDLIGELTCFIDSRSSARFNMRMGYDRFKQFEVSAGGIESDVKRTRGFSWQTYGEYTYRIAMPTEVRIRAFVGDHYGDGDFEWGDSSYNQLHYSIMIDLTHKIY